MTRVAVFAFCLVFILAGLSLIPLLGIQNDEALFAYGIFPPIGGTYVVHWGPSAVPLMIMSYVGALKAWIYRPLFAAFGTSVWVVRVPMLLAGAASVWLFFLFLRRIGGEWAALIGCGLLAADASYLLTISFDWGPVALQHLLIIGGLLLLVRCRQQKEDWAMVAGFFLFGLAMWDKASAIWSLSGLAAAGVVTIPREMLRVLSVRTAGFSVLAFVLGSFPLIAYNISSGGRTFHDTIARETGTIEQKARVLEWTADSSLLFGWMVGGSTGAATSPGQLTGLERVSGAVASLARNSYANLTLYAFGIALVLAPLAPGRDRRAILFALIAMATTWVQMAFTANAGTGAHHAILLWPLPQMVIGISLASALEKLGRLAKPVLAVTLAILMASGLAVINEYRVLLARNGGAVNWSDAIYRLSDSMKGVSAAEVVCVDWGIMGSLHLLNRGRLPLDSEAELLTNREWKPEEKAHLMEIVSRPDLVFLAHTSEFELFRGADARLAGFAEALGYRREMMAVIADRHGRPTFEVYRFTSEGARRIAPSSRSTF